MEFEKEVLKGYIDSTYQNNGLREIVIRMNLNSIDPDYQSKTVEREKKPNAKEGEAIKVKQENDPPQTLTSLNSVKKLITQYEPDILASIIVSVKGNKVALADLILDYKTAHDALWAGKLNQNFPYFVHGEIEKVIRRDSVWYINFQKDRDKYFSLVVFKRYFNHFTYSDEDLIGKDVLVYGYLSKNKHVKDAQYSEILIKSNKYIAFLT